MQRPARIAIDSTRTHQTMIGWEASVVIDEDDLTPVGRDSLIRLAIDHIRHSPDFASRRRAK